MFDGISDTKLFIVIIVGLWILWYASGGYKSPDTNKPYLTPPTPYEQSRAYGK